MENEIEVRLSFWPNGLLGKGGIARTASISLKELAEMCGSREDGCPMGCFSCPFDKKCSEVSLDDWMKWLSGGRSEAGEKTDVA